MVSHLCNGLPQGLGVRITFLRWDGGSVAHDLSLYIVLLYTAAVLKWLLVARRESGVLRCGFWLERGREDALVCSRENQIMGIKQAVLVRLRR